MFQNNVTDNMTYSIRMRLLWCMLILGATCSDADEIPLDRAVQSSTHAGYIASNAIDNDIATASHTLLETSAWLRVYLKSSSPVEKVVVEKGYVYTTGCVWTVSVYDGEAETVCETYTDKQPG